ncbi:CarD family transcriptional regulator [Desertibacillus haloalkaliphilus]|uniref:CarD family transcriptional regulator n=1 Tax=Desertibacillus haloalkaliphilus TaxID=1328930 RepID=UPI001C27926E|nr:CarD family transcriptional regulator [Desertibacillus haloalkaliphilus]
MFKIGEHVVYPFHGAGTISDIEVKDVLGETLSYYVLYFPLNDITLMLPENRIEESGLRKVIEQEEVDELVSALKNGSDTKPENPKHYSRENENLLKTGSITDAAHVIANLSKKASDRANGLHIQDRNNLEKAKQFIASELILVNNISEEEAYQFIENNLVASE